MQARRRRSLRSSRRGRRRAWSGAALLPVVLLGLVGVGFAGSQAFTASNTVPTTNISQFTQAITPAALEPPECRSSFTATSIVAGTGTFSSTAANQLVLGSAANDTFTDPGFGRACFVGGAGTDAVRGVKNGGDLCIVSAASQAAGGVKNCTVVATRP